MAKKIESAAPVLLKACRRAIRALMDPDTFTEAKRASVLEALTSAVEKAEASAFDGTVSFVTTHKTAMALRSAISALPKTRLQKSLAEAIEVGTRETKQRVYFTLMADYDRLRLLRGALDKSSLHGTKRAFARIVDQIDREVLAKSPLQHLADTGF